MSMSRGREISFKRELPEYKQEISENITKNKIK